MRQARFISSKLSEDTALGRVASASPFAALLYTWMIPHVDARGYIKSNPVFILNVVMCPFSERSTPRDIIDAVFLLHVNGLLTYHPEARCVKIDLDRYEERRRRDWHSRQWRVAVLKRDKFTCRGCGTTEGQLEAHHIKPWMAYPEHRYDVDNGITFCHECHREEHRKRGNWNGA